MYPWSKQEEAKFIHGAIDENRRLFFPDDLFFRGSIIHSNYFLSMSETNSCFFSMSETNSCKASAAIILSIENISM